MHLYLPHVAAEDDLQGDDLAIALRRQHSLYALDVRGLGESIPTPAEAAFFHPYGMDYMFHGHGLLLGQSYLGRRLHDVLSALDLLVAAGARACVYTVAGKVPCPPCTRPCCTIRSPRQP